MRAIHKKGTYRILLTSVWVMFRRTSATPADRLVFMYLEAGPHSHYTGLFQVHLVDIAEYTGLSDKEVLQALDWLSRCGLIVYDPSRQLVFVKQMLQRQLGTSTPNENNVTGIIYYVERMAEDSPAVEAFISENREISGIDELYEDTYGGEVPRGIPGGAVEGVHPGPDTTGGDQRETFDFRLETKDKRLSTKDLRDESPISDEMAARVQPSSSTSESTSKSDGEPQIKGSPISFTGKSTPGKSKAKASGKGEPSNGHGLSDAGLKKKGIAIAKKMLASGEWDLSKVSEKLRSEYGYTSEDINSKGVLDALCLFPGKMKAEN